MPPGTIVQLPHATSAEAVATVRRAAIPLTGAATDYDALIERIGAARIVLLGEASHGTHEFYAERARITRRLIEREGFTAVAVEADWPDAYRVNRFVRGLGSDPDADRALLGFERFPTWMWRNADVLDFVTWLRSHNRAQGERQAGFYGLDLYSLHASAAAVVAYLQQVDPTAAVRARERYACFEPYASDSHRYGQAVVLGVSDPCRQRVVTQLVELRRRAGDYLRRDGLVAEDEQFVAEQNARVIADAEEYYRTMFGEHAASWNLRDRHMADTLDELVAHLDRHDGGPRVVVWAHNSHVGDARHTQMRERGELNLGQLMRERHGRDAVLVGFTTYDGSVTAAQDWGDPPRRRRVRPALPDSGEALLHATGIPDFLLLPELSQRLAETLRQPRLHRAIGVIYRPDTERASHYLLTRLADQFDALVHLDRTHAGHPLEREPSWDLLEPPETYPTAL
ncbi:MAG TPA: erythromycin esterase family protein [Conexibacter sp.]|nr:erythromycin esterase family protein [Conexibacter sp.]